MEPPASRATPFKDAEHLARVAALFLLGVAAFFLAQRLFVPEGFGKYGHYRPGALADRRNLPLVFAGRAACEECHTDIAETKAKGKHARPACEACHGPLATHAADPSVKPVRPDGRTVCLRCHTALVGRPASFPQIAVAEHAPKGACTECHAAHDPGLGGSQ
jgi:predicted CXXCH cytochrome family protein